MTIVALTGGIGSGKSEVARLFSQLGVPIVDTDVIAHQLTAARQPAIEEIRANFGAAFINVEGALDRAKMRAHVFKNPPARKLLESILHPKIHAEALDQIAKNNQRLLLDKKIQYQMVVVPLLFEANLFADIGHVKLVVDCEPAQQIFRTMARSQLSEEEVRAIMQAQISRENRLLRADVVIENNSHMNDLADKVDKMHQKLTKICLKLNNVPLD